MRWTLSLTAISGKPTRTVFGRPAETSTSTSTGTPSIPTSAKVLSLASIPGRPPEKHAVVRAVVPDTPASRNHLPAAESSPLAGRADYFPPAVRPARLASTCPRPLFPGDTHEPPG